MIRENPNIHEADSGIPEREVVSIAFNFRTFLDLTIGGLMNGEKITVAKLKESIESKVPLLLRRQKLCSEISNISDSMKEKERIEKIQKILDSFKGIDQSSIVDEVMIVKLRELY